MIHEQDQAGLTTAPPEAIQALALAFYALHDSLVASGVFAPGQVDATLARLELPPSEAKLQEFLAGIRLNLREMPFRPMTVRDTLRVIETPEGEGEPERGA